MRKEVANKMVAALFLTFRLVLIGWNVGPLIGDSSASVVILR